LALVSIVTASDSNPFASACKVMGANLFVAGSRCPVTASETWMLKISKLVWLTRHSPRNY
jgi:hypothetical protein